MEHHVRPDGSKLRAADGGAAKEFIAEPRQHDIALGMEGRWQWHDISWSTSTLIGQRRIVKEFRKGLCAVPFRQYTLAYVGQVSTGFTRSTIVFRSRRVSHQELEGKCGKGFFRSGLIQAEAGWAPRTSATTVPSLYVKTRI